MGHTATSISNILVFVAVQDVTICQSLFTYCIKYSKHTQTQITTNFQNVQNIGESSLQGNTSLQRGSTNTCVLHEHKNVFVCFVFANTQRKHVPIHRACL